MTSTTKNHPLERRVESFLHANHIPRNSKIIVAYSGGPDSTALLYLLVGLQSSWKLELACAYLDHGIRSGPEMESEQRIVEQNARNLGIPLHTETLGLGLLKARAAENRLSLEQVARLERYRFLKKVRRYDRAGYIALGHHADDDVETVLMRFLQGVDITGLHGIPGRRGVLIRPLIRTTRCEIITYLEEIGARWSEDSTNSDTRFLRNSLRHELIPVLERIMPAYRHNLLGLARKMARTTRYVQTQAARAICWNRTNEDDLETPLEPFERADAVIRMQAFFCALNTLRGNRDSSLRRIPYAFVRPLLVRGFTGKTSTILAGHGIRLYRRDTTLVLTRDIVAPMKKGYLIRTQLDRRCHLADLALYVRVSREDTGTGFELPGTTEPLILRSPHTGDTLATKVGAKRIRKILSEWKVPEEVRGFLPVLADKQGIVALLGRCLGYRDLSAYRESCEQIARKSVFVYIDKMDDIQRINRLEEP